jgi:hypothetical protein
MACDLFDDIDDLAAPRVDDQDVVTHQGVLVAAKLLVPPWGARCGTAER